MAEKQYPRSVISILVENHYGVLARIASMFNRRSFNIDSIAASETIDPGITRITITVHADQNTLKKPNRIPSKPSAKPRLSTNQVLPV